MTIISELHCVTQQIEEYLPHPIRIRPYHLRHIRVNLRLDPYTSYL